MIKKNYNMFTFLLKNLPYMFNIVKIQAAAKNTSWTLLFIPLFLDDFLTSANHTRIEVAGVFDQQIGNTFCKQV